MQIYVSTGHTPSRHYESLLLVPLLLLRRAVYSPCLEQWGILWGKRYYPSKASLRPYSNAVSPGLRSYWRLRLASCQCCRAKSGPSDKTSNPSWRSPGGPRLSPLSCVIFLGPDPLNVPTATCGGGKGPAYLWIVSKMKIYVSSGQVPSWLLFILLTRK